MNNNKDNKKINKAKKLWVRILILAVLAAVLMLAPYVYDTLKNDPNIILKKRSAVLTEGETAEIKYTVKSGKRKIMGRNRLPLYSFTPEESGDYIFSVSDIVSDEDVYLSLQVTDSDLNNYLSTDNIDDPGDSFSETVFLSKGSTCYVITEAICEDNQEKLSGSFSLSVEKAPEESKPKEVSETEPAYIRLTEDSQTGVLFIPEKSGFFRFESRIVSRDRTASSVISSVKTTDNNEVKRAEGICWLKGGNEYYVWVSAHDMSKAAAKAKVWCKRIDFFSTDQPGEYRITGDNIIVFTSRETKNYAVHSVSDGDVRCLLYDDNGFPLNSDDDSGGDLSGNDKDFAIVLQAQEKKRYLIYTDGRFNECSIVITDYYGDGSSIGKDDITGDVADDQPLNNDITETDTQEPGDEKE